MFVYIKINFYVVISPVYETHSCCSRRHNLVLQQRNRIWISLNSVSKVVWKDGKEEKKMLTPVVFLSKTHIYLALSFYVYHNAYKFRSRKICLSEQQHEWLFFGGKIFLT